MTEIDDYQEENRQALIDLNKSFSEFGKEFHDFKDKYTNPPENVSVSGEVKVNTEKEVEITNLDLIEDALTKFTETITTAIKDNSYKPIEEVTVKNIGQAVTKNVEINNLPDIAQHFATLAQTIKDNKATVNVQKQELTLPRSAKEAISVRLSDGKSFYNSIQQAVSTATGETDPLVGYQPCDIDDSGSTKYYGFVKATGAWYIMREASGAYRYAVGSKFTTYTDSWTGRADLTYSYFYEVF